MMQRPSIAQRSVGKQRSWFLALRPLSVFDVCPFASILSSTQNLDVKHFMVGFCHWVALHCYVRLPDASIAHQMFHVTSELSQAVYNAFFRFRSFLLCIFSNLWHLSAPLACLGRTNCKKLWKSKIFTQTIQQARKNSSQLRLIFLSALRVIAWNGDEFLRPSDKKSFLA